MLQSPFKKRWPDFRKLEIDDIAVIAEAYVILHNMIIQMQMSGDFTEEAGSLNLVIEIFTNDVELAT